MGATTTRSLLALAVAALAFGGCGANDSGGAADAAERLYAAHAARDGDAACATLSDDTREQLEQSAEKPCPDAVLELRLAGAAATATEAYITEARVETDGGDSVFLEETGAHGWRVTAAGCRPTPGHEAPFDCEVES